MLIFARMLWTRFLRPVRRFTMKERPLMSSRRYLVCLSGLYDSAMRSALDRSASVLESILSVLILALAMALVFKGWHSLFLMPISSSWAQSQYQWGPASSTAAISSGSNSPKNSSMESPLVGILLGLTTSLPSSSRTVTIRNSLCMSMPACSIGISLLVVANLNPSQKKVSTGGSFFITSSSVEFVPSGTTWYQIGPSFTWIREASYHLVPSCMLANCWQFGS